MKKHITLFLCLFAITATSVAPVMVGAEQTMNEPVAGVTENIFSIIENATVQAKIISKKQTDMLNEALMKVDLVDRSNTMEWFKNYKSVQEEYSDWLDKDETIYDYFDSNELELMFRIVETEVRGDVNFNEKVNVANVIFNRIKHDDFPEFITEVLTEYPQFSSYMSGDYKKVAVTETTILACEYAFEFEDTTNGALYFDSTNGNSWADKHRQFLFKDSVGHSFYR